MTYGNFRPLSCRLAFVAVSHPAELVRGDSSR
jgi:hypothetical protein